MKIAYVSKPHYYCLIFIEELKKRYQVDRFDSYKEIKNPEQYDIIFIEYISGDALEASQQKHRNLIIRTRGIEVYEARIDRVKWENVNWLLGLSEHQIDYFKRRWGEKYKPRNLGVLPVHAPLKKFILRNDKQITNKVALVANITGNRKGGYQVPEFLQRFPDLCVYHLGQVCQYGNPTAEFIRWRLERDKTSNRYHWQKHIDFDELNDWLEDKTYIWLPSLSEGFNRAVLEGMCKGLKPIVRYFAGAEKLWMKESLYDRMDEIEKIINRPYKPEKYREYVTNKYNVGKVVNKFKQFI